MEAARKSYQALSQRIENRGAGYAKVYRLYEEAVERGNEHIDLNEVIWDKDVESLIQLLRENGVEYFTFFLHMVERGGNRMAFHTEWLYLGGAGGSQQPIHEYLYRRT